MLLLGVLSHTPLWVWFLLAYLLLRGIKALHSREVPWPRALIMPVIFLVWALYGMFTELPDWPIALTAFAIALAVGFAGGWMNAGQRPAALLNPVSGLLWRPGSASTLILVTIAFVSKYILSAALSMHPYLGAEVGFALLFGGVSGLVDGAFWGTTAKQFRQAFGPRTATA